MITAICAIVFVICFVLLLFLTPILEGDMRCYWLDQTAAFILVVGLLSFIVAIVCVLIKLVPWFSAHMP